MVDMVDVNKNDPDIIKYIIKFLRGNTMVVTNKFLKWKKVPDVGSIKFSSKDYINESNNLTKEKNKNIMFPWVLSPSQQEFKSWHKKLSHFHPKSMFRLAKLGVFPSIFIDLKDDAPLCASWMFGTSRSRKWITKGNK